MVESGKNGTLIKPRGREQKGKPQIRLFGDW